MGAAARLLGLTGEGARLAQAGLGALGDPGRRSIVETLARCPRPVAGLLPGQPGFTTADVLHRVRSLRHAGLVIRDHGVYRLAPAALKALSAYADLLLTVAAYSHRAWADDR